MTQVGGRLKSSLRWPVTMSASAMIPIVFCASFVPCVNATKLPETICARRNTRFTRLGDRRRITQMIDEHQRERDERSRSSATGRRA